MLRECSSRHQSVAYHQCASTLQMFTGVYGVSVGFPCNIYGKGLYKNHRETLYSSKGKIVYVVGKPCNIYRLRGNPSL